MMVFDQFFELASPAPQVVSLDLEAPSGLMSQCPTSDLVALTPIMSGREVIFSKLEHSTFSGLIFFSDEALYKLLPLDGEDWMNR